MSKPTIEEYLDAVHLALQKNREEWFPMDKSQRREKNLYLAHGIGSALRDYDTETVEKILPSLYSRLIVSNSLDSVGVVLDNRDFINAIKSRIV